MRLADLARAPLARFLAAGFALFAIAAGTTWAPTLILVLNDLVMSAAAGVCVAYAPILPGALRSAQPTRGEYLGAGIFLVSFSMLFLRLDSVIARDLGWPEIYNTDLVTFPLMTGLMGAMLHLWAPNAVEGRVPRERWVLSGIIVAIGFFFAFGSWSLRLALLVHPVAIELR